MTAVGQDEPIERCECGGLKRPVRGMDFELAGCTCGRKGTRFYAPAEPVRQLTDIPRQLEPT